MKTVQKSRLKVLAAVISVFLLQGLVGPVIASEQVKIVANDGTSEDVFGHAVAVDALGTTLVVGAPHDDVQGEASGSAYVFVKGSNGWTQQAKILPSEGQPYSYFGSSVAIHGDTILIGGLASFVPELYAYVFVRSGESWIEQAKLPATAGTTDGFLSNNFVDLDTGTAIIGSQVDGELGNGGGSVRVFERNNGAWQLQTKLVPSNSHQYDSFGGTVSLRGNTVLAWATGENFRGVVHTFERTGLGWTETATLSAADGASYDGFGSSIDFDGTRAVIGAVGNSFQGSLADWAYVFRRDSSGWVPEAKLVASDGTYDDQFGASVSVSGSRILVGAYKNNSSGSAYLFTLQDSAWTETEKLIPPSVGTPFINYGVGVAIGNNLAVVGAPGERMNGVLTGAVFVPDLGTTTPPPPSPPVFKYVALGDSYSAGEGVEPFFEPDNRCHRSQLAYSALVEPIGQPDATVFQLGRDGVSGFQWGFQACAGAWTDDVLTSRQWGDPLPQLALDRTRDTGNANDLPVDAATDLVTITIGGNNVHFSDVLQFCFRSDDCTTERYHGKLLTEYNREQRDLLSPQLDAVYQQIHAQAPDARILVLGYPNLLPASADEQNCFKLGQKQIRNSTLGFSIPEQNYLRQAAAELNQLIAARVEASGIAEFVRVDAMFAGHEVCGNGGEWINGPTLAGGETITKQDWVVNDQSFHPNSCGQEAMAALINLRLNAHLDEPCA